MMRWILFAVGRFAVGVSLAALAAATAGAAEFRVGLVLDRGGKDDKSFNSSAFLGATEAKTKLGIALKVVEAPDDNAFEPMIRGMAEKRFDLIIGIGFAQQEVIQKVALQFPDRHFAIVDARVAEPNVRSLVFAEHEGAFVVGAIAAWSSPGGKVGFVGGMDVPLIHRFALAYEAGAKHANPRAVVTTSFVGLTSAAWNNPPRAHELAVSQYDSGVEVIFAAAGASGLGVFDAAEEKKKLVIGVDANQDGLKPGRVLTSMLKRVDQAVYASIAEAQAGRFAGGVREFGLANQGVDYSTDQYNAQVLPAALRQRADALKAEILAGRVQVPDYYQRKP